MLREIKKPNRDHALRVLQCLVVAIRPLRVEELAEVLAVDFDDAEEVPKLKPNWRWEDQEQALLISCSSLITIVGRGRSRVVQFSHFSVKEFLTSTWLATSSQDVSRFHIALSPAHTILAQACISVLLQVHDHDEQDDVKNGPLALYAAVYWMRHAEFEDVASRIKGTEDLFDANKPYFAASGYKTDSIPTVFFPFTSWESDGTPLYYAARYGVRNIVEQLIIKHPEYVRAIGGYHKTPAVAALAGRHFELARFLCRKGSSVNVRGKFGNSPLHCANVMDLEMVQALLDCGADVNARNNDGYTPLIYASLSTNIEVFRLLLNHGADPNVRYDDGNTLLHAALRFRMTEMARLLVEHGASVQVKDRRGRTPLYHTVSGEQRNEFIKLHLAYKKLHRARRANCCIM